MANSNQTFKVAGITIHNGNAKVRFTDDMVRRIKQFTKGGASRVDFVELPSEMTKVEALKYLATLPEFASASDQATIADTLEDKTKEASKGKSKLKQLSLALMLSKHVLKNQKCPRNKYCLQFLNKKTGLRPLLL
jgi:hypothetical protein